MSVRPIDSFKAISFDCFGTLIDWRAGQRRVLEQFPSLRSHSDFLDQLIDARGSVERELQQKEWQPYETILEESIAQAVQEICGETLTPTEQRAFAASQVGWPAHADTRHSLQQLADCVPICLLSNCDAQTLRLCAWKHFPETSIRLFVSSEDVRAYKPSSQHWDTLLSELKLEPHEVLHVSFSPEYDLIPASQLGFQLAWIQRDGPPNLDGVHVAFKAKNLQDLCQILQAPELNSKA